MDAVLQIKNLSKSFGNRKVLDNITFNAYRGQVLGFVGPNGAGKTTTIKTVMGFIARDSGEILIDGLDVVKNYEKCMGMLGGIVENPQMYNSLSGRVNLEMYARLHDGVERGRIDEVVRLVGLENRINEPIHKYSLGMKQRLGLAQAILHRPSILIMDEPTNGLDPAGIRQMRDIFTYLARSENTAVIVSSHMLSELEHMCDRFVVINRGVIVAEDDKRPFIEKLGGVNAYRFTVDDPAGAADALIALGTECKIDVSDGYFDIECARKSLPDVNRFLSAKGFSVYEVQHITHSLEDAYLALLGGGNSIA